MLLIKDAISKASVLEILGNLMSIPYDLDRPINEDDVSESIDAIRALQPVAPAHKKGKWKNLDIYHYYNDVEFETAELRCSCCKKIVEWEIDSPHKPYYCENCGTEMKSEEEE